MKSLKKALLGLAVTAIGAIAMSQPVAAMTLTVTDMKYANPTTASIHSTSTNLNVKAGEFVVTDGTKTFLAWCVDIFQLTTFNQAVKDYKIGVPAGVSRNTVDMLALLATEALSQVVGSETSGAFQLAAWEIVNENSDKYNLDTGNFKADHVSGGAKAIAQNWLTNLPTASAYSVTWYASASKQDLAVFEKLPATVPEPATIALLGLGLLGFAGSRRKQAGRSKA